jgi:light-regulated signal transduction histidine kinase (bacteriophytochrome)
MRILIADLLKFSRVGAPTGVHPLIELQDAVQRAIENLQAAIEEAEVVLQIEALPPVHADLTEIAQVFQNLISNALKFRRDEAPSIRIVAERRGEMICVSVQDNGIGLDMKYAEKIFVLFQRLHTRDRYPGTGIGLALCRKIVERYGGTIHVESSEGEGATFEFSLPAGHRPQ